MSPLSRLFLFVRSNLIPCLLLASGFFAFTPFKIVSLVIIIWATGRLLPLGNNFGFFTRIIIAFCLINALNGFIAVLAWMLNIPLSATIVLSLLNSLLLGITLVYSRLDKQPLPYAMPNKLEWTSLVVAIISVFMLLLPVIQEPRPSRLAQLITVGGDNASHIEIFKVNDLNKGVAYGLGNRIDPPAGAINYPQSWHFNLAFLKWTVEPLVSFDNAPGKTLALFYFVSVWWVGMLIFLLTRLGLMLAMQLVKKNAPGQALAAFGVAIVILGVFVHWIFGLFEYGFQAQIGSLVLLIATLLLILQALLQRPESHYALLILATILAVSITFVWVFLAPVAFMILAAAMVLTFKQAKKWPPLYFVVAMVPLGFIACLQPFFYAIYPVYLEFPYILQRGAIQPTAPLLILTMFLVAAGLLSFYWKNVLLRFTFFAASIALLFSAGLFMYHMHELGELRYFYYKSTYTIIILLAIPLAVLAFCLISSLSAKRKASKANPILFFLLVITAGTLVLGQIQNPHLNAFINRKLEGIGGDQAASLITSIVSGKSNGYFTTFMGSCDRGDDIRAAHLSRALTFSDPREFENKGSFNPSAHEEMYLFRSIAEVAKHNERPVTVISRDQILSQKLDTYLIDKGQSEGVRIITLDQTPETEPVSQCPNRARNLTQYPLN